MPIIDLNSELAISFGFTPDKFDGWLWQTDNTIWVSFITSLEEGKGNVKQLFDNIESKGFDIIVPAPFARMKKICEARGMEMHWIQDSDGEACQAMIPAKLVGTLKLNESED